MKVVPEFKVIEGWEKLPPGYVHKDVDGVAVDSRDNVYLMTRQDARVIVYDRKGHFLRSWGEPRTGPGQFRLPGGVREDAHTFQKFARC